MFAAPATTVPHWKAEETLLPRVGSLHAVQEAVVLEVEQREVASTSDMTLLEA